MLGKGLRAQDLGLLPAGGGLVREAGGGGLAQQDGDDAPDARQVIAAADRRASKATSVGF
jgi:hypothetical protein